MNLATLKVAMGNGFISPEELDAFNAALISAGCTTVPRAAMFAAQIGHESAGLKYYEEIASGDAYEGRRDLGNVQVGDGRRFKGRGPIQVTGRNNYTALSKWAFENDLATSPTQFVQQPELLATIKYGFLGAVWYWTTQRPLNALSDAEDIIGATRAINGGTNGLPDRQVRYARCLKLGEALLPTQKMGEVTMANEAKDVQLQLRGPDLRGWVAWLYGKLESDQPRLTLVDFVRGIHQKVVSNLPVGDANNARPRPLDQPDDMFGHILSLRAQVAEIIEKLEDKK